MFICVNELEMVARDRFLPPLELITSHTDLILGFLMIFKYSPISSVMVPLNMGSPIANLDAATMGMNMEVFIQWNTTMIILW